MALTSRNCSLSDTVLPETTAASPRKKKKKKRKEESQQHTDKNQSTGQRGRSAAVPGSLLLPAMNGQGPGEPTGVHWVEAGGRGAGLGPAGGLEAGAVQWEGLQESAYLCPRAAVCPVGPQPPPLAGRSAESASRPGVCPAALQVLTQGCSI